ncbi:sigma-54-dependent transcriptional regulator [Paramagnetospirillum magneticum]|uniref:Response regulator n=1 Tax=Paramagnetospirillum magneticum (strain ATCC 700264 / AMB-1) TaxID=342108 RepID=Q2W6R5_PARM1|nr:sigma-54 dependent transcriptional regulator [Paramagnetospirillum magneticum]BAE50460.1 Response regulator [Paramagnetospirillum magneticum AMB-1]
MSAGQILFVDDEEPMRIAVKQWLGLAGFDVTVLARPEGALGRLSRDFPGILVSDVRMPGLDGIGLLKAAQAQDPDLPVILVTGHGDIPLAVEAMREGAYDFIEKPFAPERLAQAVGRACEKRRLVLENRRLRALGAGDDMARRLIGPSQAMENVRAQVRELAPLPLNVVIFGDTGCGKELVARCLHDCGPRAARPFVAVNCAAIPETMFESEFFGHEAGAFTGAAQRRAGKVEHAHGGTLFLDEVESMPLALQAKLLRVLQERCIEPLGGNRTIPVDLRVITAAKADLLAEVRAGRFREDLYYRLHVAEIRLPPLAERREDIVALFESFAALAANAHGRTPPTLTEGNVQALLAHDWPGNVRELRNEAERFALGLGLRAAAPVAAEAQGDGLQASVALFERQRIEAAFIQAQGDVAEVMRLLDLPRRTLNEKMAKYGIDRRRFLG